MKKMVNPLNTAFKINKQIPEIESNTGIYDLKGNSVTAWSSSGTYIVNSDGTWTKLSRKHNNYPQVPLFSRKVCRQQLIQCANMECIGCPYNNFSDPGYSCKDRLMYDAWYYLRDYDIGDIIE